MAWAAKDWKSSDARYRRFGVLLGVGVALALHAALFLIPSSGTEVESPFQRGIKAKAFRHARAAEAPPAQAPRPQAPSGIVPKENAQAEKLMAGTPPPGAVPAYHATETTFGQQDSGMGRGAGHAASGDDLAGAGTGEAAGAASMGGRGKGGGGEGGTENESSRQGQAWESVLAEMEKAQGGREALAQKKWTAAEVQAQAREAARLAALRESGGDAMDSRIRAQIVSYPPTSIEGYRPRIAYPRKQVVRRDLSQATCRVYLRLWTDDRGDIVKEQLKTPSSEADRKLYADFISAVRDSARKWPFDAVEAEIHVDVLFELREAD